MSLGVYMFTVLGDVSSLKKALRQGDDVNAVGSDRETALMVAAQKDDHKIVKILLSKKAKVDLQDKDGKSALMYSLSSLGDGKSAKLLLSKGANSNLQDNEGISPLILASEKGNAEMVKLLLTHKAQVDLQDKNGNSSLMHAVGSFGDLVDTH